MNTGNLNNSVTKINNIRFSDTWKGSAAEVQVDTLNSFMEDFNKCISDLNDFNFILEKRKKYEEICSQIADLYAAINSCDVDHDDPDSSCSCGTYAAKIAELEKQRLDLRNEIIALLAKFVGIDVAELCPPADLSATSFDVRYLFDIDALIAIYSTSGALTPTPPGYGLFDMYNEYDENGQLIPYSGENYVNQQIANVVAQCRNEREIAVNVSLLFAKLAADKGYSLTYENPGAQGGVDGWEVTIPGTSQYTYHPDGKFDPSIVYDKNYNNVTQMEEGMDCCAWVSYALNVATADNPAAPNPDGFAWKGVGGLNRIGEQVSSSEVKPGDIFIAPSTGNPTGHTGMIMRVEEDPNNPGTGKVVVAESGGSKSMYSINEYRYTTNPNGTITMLTGGTTFRNMDSIYSGEEVSRK